jgi:hypothetical protein
MCVFVQGKVSWITQLVVHSDYRQRGVAKKLCRLAWAVDHYYAAGLVTSHPYAVRALERATQRSCDRATSMHAAHEIVACCTVPYVQGKTLCFEDGRYVHPSMYTAAQAHSSSALTGFVQTIACPCAHIACCRCLIDTHFFVDHTGVNHILQAEMQRNNWKLGQLERGKEFVAFTFAASPKVSPTGNCT